MEKNLTQGSIKKHYFKYLGVAFGSSMISCIYGLVDVAVVGQYQGPQGTAALSIVAPVWTILYSLGILTGSGGSIKYTYYKAQGKTSKANAYFTLSLLLTSVIAVVCWIGLTVFDDQLLRLFGADDILLPLAKTYLRPIQFVIPAYPFTQMLAAYLRNDNAPGVAAFAALCGGCFNIFGDLYFAFGLDMGMFGAGLATAIGVTLTIAVMVSHFFSRKNALRLSRVGDCIHKAKELVFNGCSTFVSEIAMGIIVMLFNRQIMNYLGLDALAVFGVIVQISGLVQCFTYAAGQAAQPIISENYSVHNWERIKETQKYSLWTVAVFGVLWTAAVLLFPNAFVKVFMSPTDSVLRIAPGIMQVYGLAYLLLPLNIFATYYFQSVMQPKTALIVSMARGIVLCGILVFVLPALFGAKLLWWVMPVTELAVAIYTILCMVKSNRSLALK